MVIAMHTALATRDADTVYDIYLKLPQMSPNTSSLFACMFIADADDPKAPAFAPARLPVDSPHMSLPELSKDGCRAGVVAPQTFTCTGGTGLLQL